MGQTITIPSLVDVHVHFREPGYSYKETIRTGSMAAAAGGYTCVCPMPNLNPVPDTPEHIEEELEIIRRDGSIDIRPYASITTGRAGKELVDIEALKPLCVAFSDDGSGVQNPEMMRRAMEAVRANDCILAAHCEDNTLLRGGYIHDGSYAREHGHKGICSESEWGQIERDLRIAEETGAAYHVCHISTRESVELIRKAKMRGVDVTCETAPHYLVLCEDDLQEDGRFKMNPPLRSASDRAALIEGLLDGTIDMIATDHAPHSAEEKSRGLRGSAMGVTGLECAFPVMYTEFVAGGILSLDRLVELMCINPRRRFRLWDGPAPFTAQDIIDKGDYAVFEIGEPYPLDPDSFRSMGHSTPFADRPVIARCLQTVYHGTTVYLSHQ